MIFALSCIFSNFSQEVFEEIESSLPHVQKKEERKGLYFRYFLAGVIFGSCPDPSFDRCCRCSCLSSPLGVSRSTPSSASSLYRLIDEDVEDSAPGDEDLMPHKRRSVDTSDGVARVADIMEGDFSLRKMATIVIGDKDELVLEISRLEEVDGDASSPSPRDD